MWCELFNLITNSPLQTTKYLMSTMLWNRLVHRWTNISSVMWVNVNMYKQTNRTWKTGYDIGVSYYTFYCSFALLCFTIQASQFNVFVFSLFLRTWHMYISHYFRSTYRALFDTIYSLEKQRVYLMYPYARRNLWIYKWNYRINTQRELWYIYLRTDRDQLFSRLQTLISKENQ